MICCLHYPNSLTAWPVDYILRKDEEEQQREQDNKREIMELYRDMISTIEILGLL